MFGECSHRGARILISHSIQNSLMVLLNALQLRRVVPSALHREDANQQTSVINDFKYSRIPREAEQQRVKAKIAPEKALHLFCIELRRVRLQDFVPQVSNLVDHELQPVQIRRAQRELRHLADAVDLQRLAQFIQLDDVVALDLRDYHPAIRSRAKQSLSGELIHCLTDGRAAAPELFRQAQL